MSDPTLSVDQDLLVEFIDESTDLLASLDSLFVDLEERPDDTDLVNAIFRPVHSIKGNSAFFGFQQIKSLAHEMETILDHVRKDRMRAGRAVISTLLEGLDELKSMLERVRNGEGEVTDEHAIAELRTRISGLADRRGGGEIELDGVLGMLQGILQSHGEGNTDLSASLGEVIQSIHELLGDEASNDEVPAPYRRITTLLGRSESENLEELELVELRGSISALRDTAQNDEARAVISDCLDNYDTIMGAMGFDPLLRDLLREKLGPPVAAGAFSPPREAQAQEPQAADENGGAAPRSEPKAAPARAAGNSNDTKTMRVNEAHIDTFLAYVGELLVVGDMFEHLEKRMARSNLESRAIAEFRRANETFDSLSSDLQRSIMSIRKVSVRSLLQKIPRMIRDIAQAKGKEIAVEITGEGIEVDKSLIDLLDAPLTHMVRNAADHGIETPEQREEKGKPRSGTVTVSASLTDTHVELSVSDDGAGLDLDAIRGKAESMGLIRPDQPLTEKDLVDLIFSSGVSTAREVTDVSGRGVGMDVVKRQIIEAGGSISIETKAGEGSRFVIHLPQSVTTQIMNGYMIRVNGQSYVLPMERVAETSGLRREEVHSVGGLKNCVKRHGRILPMARMQEILCTRRTSREWVEEETLVTVESRGEVFALCVDDVLGVQQVVHRRIDGLPMASEMISGGALMGDGTVALILDIDRLYDDLKSQDQEH